MKIAILADIHANIYAFNEVLADIQKESVDKIIVAGDLVGYYYWPSEVVNICMQDSKFICVRGNHEDNLKLALSEPDKLDSLTKKYGSSYRICLETLSIEQVNWLLNLPQFLDLKIGNTNFYITHGSLKETTEYVYPNADFKKLKENISNSKFTILAHTHYPFIHSWNDKWLINPGSVGQPRDFGNIASYFIVNLETNLIVPKRIAFPTKVIAKHVDIYDKDVKYLKSVLQRGSK
jgi:putative phosphoesterase|tara:strand:- start:394 stop:1098 length:705 start_codon:yes stop_codon:yes gene_type:complete